MLERPSPFSGDDHSDDDQSQRPRHSDNGTQKSTAPQDDETWKPTNSFQRCGWPAVNKAWHQGVNDGKSYYKTKNRGMKAEKYEKPGRPGCPYPIFDEFWDQRDEERLVRRWTDSGFEAAVNRLNNKSDWSLLGMWKASFRLFRIDPLSIFSFYGDMEFDRKDATSPVWSQQCCRKLSVLMSHPIRRGKIGYWFLAFAVKWAAICRTDDRRPLAQEDIDQLAKCNFHLDPGATDKPLGQRHQEHQRTLYNENQFLTPQARLLSRIWELSEQREPKGSAGSGMHYIIITRDLTAVTEALDRLDEGTMCVPCEAHFQVFQAAKGSRDYPSGFDELKRVFKNCWFNVERTKIRHCRMEAGASEMTSRLGSLEAMDEEGTEDSDGDSDAAMDGSPSPTGADGPQKRPRDEDTPDSPTDRQCRCRRWPR